VSPQTLRIAFAIGALLILVVGATLTFGGINVGMVGLLLLMAGGPLLLYVAKMRSVGGSVIGGVAMLVLALLVQLYVSDRWLGVGSSTAAVGYLYLPMFGFPLALAAWGIEHAAISGSSADAESREDPRR
jgi:hypothetical protein